MWDHILPILARGYTFTAARFSTDPRSRVMDRICWFVGHASRWQMIKTRPSKKRRDDLLRDLMVALQHLNTLDWKQRGFHMGWWGDRKRPETPELGCDTSACAYGVGTTLPSWKAAGIRLYWDGLDLMPVPDAKDRLGLFEREWDFLFMWRSYGSNMAAISPGHVADRIQHFLEGGGID